MTSNPESPQVRASLANWREPGFNRWAFQHVRELMPSAVIAAAPGQAELPQGEPQQIGKAGLTACAGASLEQFMLDSASDAMLVLQQGKVVWRWQASDFKPHNPHILFSMSKSITALLIGILVDQRLLDPAQMLVHYLPGCRGSAYADCSLQQLLDMQVALDFDESYLQVDGAFKQYRDATGWNPVDQRNPGDDLESFLYRLGKSEQQHGKQFAYKSPNSDLLGLLVERVAGQPYADFMAEQLWQPIAAQRDGYVTVDRSGLARAAGGICVCIDDFARIGQLMLDRGSVNGQQVIAESWVEDIWTGGSREAWVQGEVPGFLPEGRYRNQWYLAGGSDQAAMAIGIHGQWLYVEPSTSTVIVRFSSQPDPMLVPLDLQTIAVFDEVSRLLG